MNEPELPPENSPVDIYLDLLRARMDSEDYRLLIEAVEPALRAIEEHRLPEMEFAIDDRPESLPPEIRDEAVLVIAAAVTGRLDNEVVEISLGDENPVRLVTDADTATDPERLGEIATYLRERRRQDEVLRGIAEASDLPTDL